MLTFIMNLIANMIEKPVVARSAKEYAFVFDYWDMWENEVNVKTDGYRDSRIGNIDLIDWDEEADSLS